MTKDFDSLARIIEGSDFRFIANQAAGLNMFRRIVQEQDVFRSLLNCVSDRHGELKVLERIYYLASLDTDAKCENPNDTALATYLMALDAVASRYAKEAVIYLVSSTLQLWWAARIANDILTRSQPGNRTADVVAFYKGSSWYFRVPRSTSKVVVKIFPIKRPGLVEGDIQGIWRSGASQESTRSKVHQ